MNQSGQEPVAEGKMKTSFNVYCQAELKRLAEKAADKADVPLSEYVADILAKHLGRPKLAEVPRKRMGRPRVQQPA